MKTIYLDYAANTPVDEQVLKEFEEATIQYYGNPNSSHDLGLQAKAKIDQATANIFTILQEDYNLANDMEIIYTSGASESNNLAIKGLARSYRNTGKHIITTFLEHASVSGPLSSLQEQGYEVDLVNIQKNGQIDLEHLKELMRKDTILVAVSAVDSELGTIQPIVEIAKVVKQFANCALLVDCTQAIGKIKVDLQKVDLISFAPHKFYGLNGFGVLLKNKNIVLEPLINGGNSFSIYRSGTPVTGQIVALESALKISSETLQQRFEQVVSLNNYLRENFAKYKLVQINTPNEDNPFILNLSVNGVKAVEFKKRLEEYGVCISIKSACSVTLTPSRAVMAITKDKKRALSSWRISLSHLTAFKEIDEFLKIFSQCYKELC